MTLEHEQNVHRGNQGATNPFGVVQKAQGVERKLANPFGGQNPNPGQVQAPPLDTQPMYQQPLE